MTLTVTRSCTYKWNTNVHGNGMEGQLVELQACAGAWTGTVYVRERAVSDMPSFYINSAVRNGQRHNGDPNARQVLQLCAPAERWDAIAKTVADMDSLRRPVERARGFTAAWAEQAFARPLSVAS